MSIYETYTSFNPFHLDYTERVSFNSDKIIRITGHANESHAIAFSICNAYNSKGCRRGIRVAT